MSWTESRIFQQFVADALADAQQFDLSGTGTDGFKTALFNDTPTPDRTVLAANSCYGAGVWLGTSEIWQTGQWAQAGLAFPGNIAITTPGGGVVMWDADDIPSGTAFSTLVNNGTLGAAYGTLTYDDDITSPADQGVCYNYLGGPNQVPGGQLTVVWHTNGLFRITV